MKSKFIAIGAAALAQITFSGAAHAAISGTVYVDCSQATNGTGTQANPFNTLASLNTTVAAGTSILFKRGTTCKGQFKSQGSGTATNPIKVGDYGTATARAVIDGNGIAGNMEAGAVFYLLNQEYWEVSKLEITNSATTKNVRSGVVVMIRGFKNGTDSSGAAQGIGRHIYLDGLYIHDIVGGAYTSDGTISSKASNGIFVGVDGTMVPNWYDDIQIKNNTITNVDREGITTGSSQNCRAIYTCTASTVTGVYNAWQPFTNVVVKNNRLSNIGGDGIIVRVSKNALIHYNTGYNLATKSWEGAQASSAGFWTINSDNSEFAWNEVSFVRHTGSNNDGTAFDADFSNNGVTFKWNYSHDNDGGFMLFCGCAGHPAASGSGGTSTTNVVVRDNISINDGLATGRIFLVDGVGSLVTKNSNNLYATAQRSKTIPFTSPKQTILSRFSASNITKTILILLITSSIQIQL